MAGGSFLITKCISARGRGRLSRVALASAICALALGACGGDDEDGETEGAATTTAPVETDSPTITSRTVETAPESTTPTATVPREGESPEDQPGGAGDEEAARSEANFTGSGGQIRPRVVLVPPFIAIRVELRSADGGSYSLQADGGRRLAANGRVASVSTTFDGLRPGRRIVLRGTGGRVIVEASAEPGP